MSATRISKWIAENPSKTAGVAFITPAAAFATASVADIASGNTWQGAFRLLLAGCELAGALTLVTWGDPKIKASAAEAFTDPQDKSFWQRITSPRQAPHDFAAAMGIPANAALVLAATTAPSTTAVIIAASGIVGTAAMMAAERSADAARTLSSRFMQLAKPALDWVRKRPTRAACWLWAPANGCFAYEGMRAVNWQQVAQGGVYDAATIGGLALMTTGIGYHTINMVRARASKRTAIIAD